jgi:membrane protein implicated in regulation of membrane protease activity
MLAIVVGVPAWIAVATRPGFIGRLNDRLLKRTTPDQVRTSLEEHDELFRFARKSFEKASQTGKTGPQVDPAASGEIAALNLFVEKSQISLRRRAVWFGAGAAICVLLDVVVAIVALVWLTGSAADSVATWQALVLWVLRSGMLAALSFGLVYLFTSLARVMFNAANAALEKRNSLDFGRLYVQMKVLSTPDGRRATRSLSETELLRAFGSNTPPEPPEPAEPPVRTLALPGRGSQSVRTLGSARNGDGAEPAA